MQKPFTFVTSCYCEYDPLPIEKEALPSVTSPFVGGNTSFISLPF